MYCEYFDLREKPFTVTPNPRFIFLSKNHREAFAHLLYGINNHAGFIELTGEIGTGKTTVLRTLLDQLDEKTYTTALIFNPCLSATELLRCINREYGIPGEGLSNAELLQELNGFLLREKTAGRTVALVIDEAQNLDPSVLEQIRLISNLETDTDKLIQIVIAGQPELGALLEKPELRQLAQRITVRYHLGPLDLADTREYISHRLKVAGCGLGVHFTPSATEKIFRYSRGTPRLINIVCDRALLVGYGEGQRVITHGLVSTAIREISREKNPRPRGLRSWIAGISLVAALTVCFAYIIRGEFPKRLFSLLRGGYDRVASAGSDSTGFSGVIGSGLAGMTERDSFLASFNALAKIWKVRPVKEYRSAEPGRVLDQLAGARGLHPVVVKGDMKNLIDADSPALLEFTIPGHAGKRYLALVGREGDRLLIEPALSGRRAFTVAELKPCWSGRAFVFWKNFREIPLLPSPGYRGAGIIRLQDILAEAGFHGGGRTGRYDNLTVSAVKDFQRTHGLEPDGRVGGKTLLSLYRAGNGFPVPRLTLARGEGKR